MIKNPTMPGIYMVCLKKDHKVYSRLSIFNGADFLDTAWVRDGEKFVPTCAKITPYVIWHGTKKRRIK